MALDTIEDLLSRKPFEPFRIVTSSGIYGTISKITDRTVKVKIADSVTIELSKAAISGYERLRLVIS